VQVTISYHGVPGDGMFIRQHKYAEGVWLRTTGRTGKPIGGNRTMTLYLFKAPKTIR